MHNILIVGLGSIGARHLKNLVSMGFENISVVTREGKKNKEFIEFDYFQTIKEACSSKNISSVIICSPSSNHLAHLEESIVNGIANIYVEKPISHSLNDIQSFQDRHSLDELNIVVGYDLRFDPALQHVKKLISNNKIGKVLSFISEVGQYLPDWRPEKDYRKTMSAQKLLGGGVMLDLIHEYDYINWLFGPIDGIYGKNNKLSNLDIDTEDISVNIFETSSGVLGTLHLDYIQYEMSRSCKIIGDHGLIIWDYVTSSVKVMTSEDRCWVTKSFNHYKRNDRFVDIMRAFLNSCVGAKDKRLVSFSDAIQSINLVEKSKQSNHINKMIII